MLNRKTTIANAVLVAALALPIVWLIGYGDHRWRNTGLAVLAAALLIGASLALKVAGADENPPIPRALPAAALVSSVTALACALLWGLFAI